MGLLALDPLSARVFTLDLNGNEAPLVNASDQVTYDADGTIQRISGTTEAAVKVFLPDAENNTGAAVIICSGGALMFHSWGNDVEKMAAWLNERGVAVIGLKYRLRQMQPRPAAPAPGNTPAMRLQLPDITGFDQLKNANASPDQSGAQDPSLAPAAEDAIRTIRLVRAHAAEWGIDPNRVGYLGYSAGGGVAIEATLRADAASMPSFLASCYGPSLTDVSVPDNAPNLFIAVRAQHNNVAAGMLALFTLGGVTSTVTCHAFGGKGVWFAVIPLVLALIDLLYADLRTERGEMERKPRGH